MKRFLIVLMLLTFIRAIKFAKVLMKNNPNMNIDGDDGK